MKLSALWTNKKLFLAPLFLGLLLSASPAQDEDDDSLQALYYKANDFMAQNNFEGALQTFNQIVDVHANPSEDYSWDDWGPMFGGVFYDKGTVHLQLGQFEEAATAFEKCRMDYPNTIPFGNRKEKSRASSTNQRWDLCLFQWGYAEQMLGNYDEALDLYQQFIDSKPDPNTLREVQTAFILRKGTALIGAGRVDEGEAEITRLFSEYDTFASKPTGTLLFQGMLELAKGWIKRAETDPAGATKTANDFLNAYNSIFSLSPYDMARLGFMDRLRLAGFEANQAGLHEIALRFFSMAPTTQDIIADLESRAAQTSAGARASYDQVIAQFEEKLKLPDPPELETLRLVAAAWEGLGNQHAGFVINQYLVENYPDSKNAPIILHEAARFAFNLGEGSAAQYYGETFMEKYPQHELRDNVATFMLHSLFRNQEYETCVEVARNVRLNYSEGEPQRELADYIYGASLYSLGKHDEAQEALKIHIDNYPNSTNRESARFYFAFSKLSQQKYSEAAPLLDGFLKDYPNSNFKDNVLLERATCYFISDDYVSALSLAEQVLEEYPKSLVRDRAYILKGDTISFLGNTPEGDRTLESYQLEAIEAFKAAKETAEVLEHPDYRAEAIFKLVDILVDMENWTQAVAYYDQFFPDHIGHFFEPQISVFGMPALEAEGRAEDGLAQLERMIIELSDTDKVDLLAQCIGSYQDASIKNRGYEATVSKYDEMIAVANPTLQTWLLIHQIIAYQDQKKADPEADKAALDQKIDVVFNKLKEFEIKDLSDIALQEIGKYLERTNPFQALPYFEELLVRDNKLFQAPAVMALGRIEAKSGDSAKVDNAIQRFKRVITDYQDPEFEADNLMPEAHLNLGRIGVDKKDWDLARQYLQTYINKKSWDAGRKDRRAEAMHLYGVASMEKANATSDPKAKEALLDEAIKVFNANWATYKAYPEWSAKSVEEGFNLTYNRDWPAEEKRDKQIQAYTYLRVVLYSWQNIPSGESDALDRLRLLPAKIEGELGLTGEEINTIETEKGLNQ